MWAQCFWLTSCNDDDEPKDTTAPEISFTNLTADKEIWNTVTISLDANDNNGIDKVEVFIDGNLITTITEAPFEVSWDSNTVTDGSHTVKVVATDKAGNMVEKEVTILVKNILVSIDFAANHLIKGAEYNEQGFVFLSDETGKVIASAEYSNGQHLELKSSTFNGEKFYLTEAFIKKGEENSVDLWTYIDVDRGKWVVLDAGEGDEDEEYVGEATLNFYNLVPEVFYTANSNGEPTNPSESKPSSVIKLTKSPSKLYVVYYEEGIPAYYHLYSDIVIGENIIDLNAINESLTKVIATTPDDASSASVVNGLDIPLIGSPDFYSINDYENINDYNDFKTFIRNSKNSLNDLWANGKNYVSVDFSTGPTNGRKKRSIWHAGLGEKVRKGK